MNEQSGTQNCILEALGPKDDLSAENSSFSIYKKYLDDAFGNKKIRNLALSGSLGSGKSSIIRSYDHARNNDKKHFLYVSLIDFANPASNDQEQLERSLLNQIMSFSTKKDLPEGSISGIPEKFRYLKFCAGCLSALCFAVYMLIFHEQFGHLAARLSEVTFLGFSLSNFLTENFRASAHLVIYALVGTVLSICAYRILCHCLPYFRLSKLTLKTNNAEAELSMGKESTSLELHKFELAYVLERIGEKHDYTVVFEDLERLNPDIAIDIMKKLRELNILTNNHIQANRETPVIAKLLKFCNRHNISADSPIRFIYAISDSTLSAEHRTKFYDCIIPVVPISNPLNGKEMFCKILQNLGINASYRELLCDALADAMLDYRTCLTLKNEFLILWDFCQKSKTDSESSSKDKPEANACNMATLFAITAYKILLPQCFQLALSPKGSGILPRFDSPKDEVLLKEYLEHEQREKVFYAIRALHNGGLLGDCCLRLVVGDQQLVEHWLNIILKTLDKDTFSEEDKMLAEHVISALEALQEKPAEDYCSFRSSMSARLHSLCSEDQEDKFILVARSLAAVSDSNVPKEWEWIIQIPDNILIQRAFFCRCVAFLSKNNDVLVNNRSILSLWFDTLCNNMIDTDMSDSTTKWTEEMYKVVSVLLSDNNKLTTAHRKNTFISSRSLFDIACNTPYSSSYYSPEEWS